MNTPQPLKKSLICTLSDEERRNYGIELATTLEAIEEVEDEKKKNADRFKDRIAGLQGKADDIRQKVSSGQEWRDVECSVIYNEPVEGRKQIVRNDTGEVVATEWMTDSEKQFTLPLDSPDDTDADAVEVESEVVTDERNEVEVEHDAAEGAGADVPEFLKKKSRKKKADAPGEPMPEQDPEAPTEAADAGDY
jgi:hypothetical protein